MFGIRWTLRGYILISSRTTFDSIISTKVINGPPVVIEISDFTKNKKVLPCKKVELLFQFENWYLY